VATSQHGKYRRGSRPRRLEAVESRARTKKKIDNRHLRCPQDEKSTSRLLMKRPYYLVPDAPRARGGIRRNSRAMKGNKGGWPLAPHRFANRRALIMAIGRWARGLLVSRTPAGSILRWTYEVRDEKRNPEPSRGFRPLRVVPRRLCQLAIAPSSNKKAGGGGSIPRIQGEYELGPLRRLVKAQGRLARTHRSDRAGRGSLEPSSIRSDGRPCKQSLGRRPRPNSRRRQSRKKAKPGNKGGPPKADLTR